MKTRLSKQNLTTVYLLLIVCCCTVGCLSQSSDMISHSSNQSDDALIASKKSSSFKFFGSKKSSYGKEQAARVQISGPDPEENQISLGAEAAPSEIELAGHTSQAKDPATIQRSKPERITIETPLENWRSKSLVESAKKNPVKVAEVYHRKVDQIKGAASSVGRQVSQGIQRVSNTVAAPETKPEQNQPDFAEADSNPFRTRDIERTLDQLQKQDVENQFTELRQELKQDLKQTQPVYEDLNQEMRRLQIDSIMTRAKRELKQKNYEYAEFLAAQALESSYRGHVAFGIEEQSPKMLLEQIQSQKPATSAAQEQAPSPVEPVQHSEPIVQTNSGQTVNNFQFQPSRVHPLKRRAVPTPKETAPVQPRPRPATSGADELPLIVPRNVGPTPRATTIQPRQQRDTWSRKPRPGSISLEPPSFEEQSEEPLEIPIPKRTEPDRASSVPSPSLGIEEIPEEAPARIRLSGPEISTSEPTPPKAKPEMRAPVKSVETTPEPAAPSAPGPQLMLPTLPGPSGDQTSQTESGKGTEASMMSLSGAKQGVQTAPVGFRSKIQDRRENREEAGGPRRNGPLAETSLTLDDIEWDLEEKKRPQIRSAWSGMTTLLLIVGGVIILLLLMIIVILMRRSKSSS